MKALFDQVSYDCSRNVTHSYSTSFSTAVKLLAPSIRQDIYNIYGFVRLSDEIVDSFHDYDKAGLLHQLRSDLDKALLTKISVNPVINAFQHTVHKYAIPPMLIDAFMASMEADLYKSVYTTKEEYKGYIYGSADVVGLMCLKVFVRGDDQKFDELKEAAMRLGSGLQKINFLRDLKADFEGLNRTYFPDTDLEKLDEESKQRIITEIEADLKEGFDGILRLPIEAKLGVYVAYVYYKKLLAKLKRTPSYQIRNARIRVPNYQKLGLFAKCYMDYKLNFI
jgi:phytoene/squalene synthetase